MNHACDLAGTGLRTATEENEGSIVIRQRFYVDEVALTIDKKRCILCDICTKICPKEAITLLRSGNCVHLSVDPQKCVLCGACEPLCPTKAVRVSVNGVNDNILLRACGLPQGFPKVKVDKSKCPIDCFKCANACPVGAVNIDPRHELAIDEDNCLRCPWCIDACDKQAITVNPIFLGTISIDTLRCSENCDLCVRSCPTKAISMMNNEARINARYCNFCGACLIACKDNAISMRRYHVLVSEGFSTIWSSALRKITDERLATRQFDQRTKKRIVSIIKDSGLI